MWLDNQNLFDDNVQHLTTGASTNVIDLSEARNLGVGEPLYIGIFVKTAFTDTNSDSTMAITVETDDNESFTSPTTAQTIGTFGALSAAGTKFFARLQPDAINERYVRLKYTVAGGDLTTGKFTAGILKDIQAFTAYADSLTIS